MWVLLSGEHDTLPAAELQALAAAHGHPCTQLANRVWETTEAVCTRLAYGWYWMEEILATTDNEAGWAAVQAAIPPGTGTVAVRVHQVGSKGRRSDLQRRFGTDLQAAGWHVDLEAPEHTLMVWVSGSSLFVGWQRGSTKRDQFELRGVNDRSHFQPVGLHPRLAACLVHLARVPNGGAIADPFCGTGGILMEAALDGYEVYGSDIDPFMVQGSYQTLTDQAPEPLDATLFVADIAQVPDMLPPVDGVVADLPYGVASTTRNEGVRSLYERAFAAFAHIVPPNRYAVLGCPDPELLASITKHGFHITESHAQFVHKSLTRHFVVVKRQMEVQQL